MPIWRRSPAATVPMESSSGGAATSPRSSNGCPAIASGRCSSTPRSAATAGRGGLQRRSKVTDDRSRFVPAGAPPGGAPANRRSPHLGPAPRAALALLAVLHDRSGVHAALGDRRPGRAAKRAAKHLQIVRRQRLTRPQRRDPCLPQRFVSQQIADTSDDALVQQPRLDRRGAATKPLSELLGSDQLHVWPKIAQVRIESDPTQSTLVEQP